MERPGEKEGRYMCMGGKGDYRQEAGMEERRCMYVLYAGGMYTCKCTCTCIHVTYRIEGHFCYVTVDPEARIVKRTKMSTMYTYKYLASVVVTEKLTHKYYL